MKSPTLEDIAKLARNADEIFHADYEKRIRRNIKASLIPSPRLTAKPKIFYLKLF